MGNLYQTDINGNTFCQKLGIKIPTQYVSGLIHVGSFVSPIQNVNTGTATGSQVNPPNQIWQSFTTTAAGQLFSIQWDFVNLPANGGYVAKLYLGNGIGGTLLATVPASGSGSPATLVIDFTSVLPALANATQYTIQITPNVGTQNYTLATLTGYSGGNAIIGPPASFPVRVFTGNITNYFSIDNSGNATFLNTVNANISGNAATATLSTTATIANGVASHSVTNAGLSQMAANTVKANITGSTADASDVSQSSFKTWLGLGSIGANQIAFGNGSSVLSGDSNLTYQSLGSVNTVLLNGGTLNLGAVASNTDGKKISIYDPNAVTSPTNRYQHTGFGTTNGTLEVELYDNTKSVQFYAATSTLTRTNIASLSGAGNLNLIGTVTATQGLFSNGQGVIISGSTPSLHIGSNTDIGEATAGGNFATNAVAGDSVIRCGSSNTLRLLAGGGSSVLDITASLANLNFPITLAQTQNGSSVSGSVKSNFEYYEDEDGTTAFTTNSTGAIVFTNYKIRFKRVGTKVFMFPDTFNQNAVAGSSITLTTAIPSRFRPPSNLQFNVSGQNGGAKTDISFTLSTAGNISIFGGVNGNNFTNGNVAAYFGQGMSYYLV